MISSHGLQVKSLKKDLELQRQGVQKSEEEIRLLRKELHKKAEALHAAKTELKQLKHQVQQQLKELQLTSMCPQRFHACFGSTVSQHHHCTDPQLHSR